MVIKDILSFKKKILIFSLPLLFLFSTYLILTNNASTYEMLFGVLENGLFEWVQFFCYILSAIVGFLNFKILRGQSRLVVQRYLIVLFILGCSLIAMEEISWGQHIFHWTTPQNLSEINAQNETNLHNLNFIQINNIQVKAFIAVALFGSFSWLFKRNSGKLSIRDLLTTEWFISSYFLPIAFFYIQLLYIWGHGNEHQETFETVLSFGFLSIALINYKKSKYFIISATK